MTHSPYPEVIHFGSPPEVKPKKKKKRKKNEPSVGEQHDAVVQPSHYQYEGLEVIDLAEQMSFSRGSIVKYVARAGRKPGGNELQDLEKAAYLLDREIDRVIRGS